MIFNERENYRTRGKRISDSTDGLLVELVENQKNKKIKLRLGEDPIEFIFSDANDLLELGMFLVNTAEEFNELP